LSSKVESKESETVSELSYTKRQRQLRNLVVMALADGSIGQREVNLVADRCVELGLGERDLEAALQFGLGEDAALELPSDPGEREALLADMIRMMAADGRLDESEKRLFALSAARMEIGGDRLQQIIASVTGDAPSDDAAS